MAKSLQTVIFTIDRNAKMTSEVKGIKGKGCLDVTKVVEDAVGKVDKRDPKPEMNEKIGENVRIGS